MQIEVQKGKHLIDGTEMTFVEVENAMPLVMPKRTTPPHPDLINAMALLDPHCALLTPYMVREGDIKRKQMKEPNEVTDKIDKWFRPEFTDKQMADDFHCTSFYVNEKGAMGMYFTVSQEGKAGTGVNVKPKALVEGDLFESYEYLEDLRRVLKIVQHEFELYRNGKVDPRSQSTSTGEENVPSVGTEAISITGVGGKKDDTDLNTYQDVNITNRIADSKTMEAKTKGKQQTADNPSGSKKK